MTDKIYMKISRALEDEILSGNLRENSLVPSTNQYAEKYEINPATAAKGVALLTNEGILYKKRGIGLYVAEDARDKILERRKLNFREKMLTEMMQESHKIGISKRDLIAMIMAVV